jgi:hypothetical protein
MADPRTDMNIEDFEALAQFLIELKELIRSEHVDDHTQLRVIDHAIDIAIDDNPDAAIEFIHDVVLGRPYSRAPPARTKGPRPAPAGGPHSSRGRPTRRMQL